MKVVYGLGKKKWNFKKVIAAIGVFDGAHIGHQAIIRKTISSARRKKARSLVITFWPHPIKVLRRKSHSLILTSLDHRINLIRTLNPDLCLVIKFTKSFAKLKPRAFVNNLKAKINIVEIVVGEDFVFGKHTEGNVGSLKSLGDKLGFAVTILPEYKIGKFSIRSNFIRNLIKNGNLKKAKDCLGRYVSVYGEVVRGSLRGRLLGYPTANIKTYQEIIPPEGVYLVRVIIDKKSFFGICNIGKRPTFADVEHSIIEAHIFDFKKDIYAKNVEVIFLEKIRKERKFNSRDKLIERINKDELRAKVLIKKSAANYRF